MGETFLHTYFNFAYFILLVPYRFKRNPTSGTFHAVEWMPQKVVCAVSHVVILFLYSIKVHRAFLDTTFNNHVSIFSLFAVTFSLFYKITLVKTFWVKKKTIQVILNSFKTDPNLNDLNLSFGKSRIESSLLCYTLFGIYCVIATTRLFTPTVGILFMDFVQPNCTNDSFSNWYFSLKYQAKCILFLLQQPCETGQVFTLPHDGILLIMIVSMFLGRVFMSYFSDIFVLVIVLTLNEPVKKFTGPLLNELERDNLELDTTGKDSQAWVKKMAGGNDKMVLAGGMTPSIVTLVARYEALKRLSFKLNNVIGSFFLFYLSEAVITYAIHLYDRFEIVKRWNLNPLTSIVHILYYITTFFVFFISSEICRQMNFFKSWLFDKRRSLDIDMNEFHFLLDSVSSKVVSISAYDVVTMSYSMIGTILGLVLTFFIVSLTSPQL
ncbi:unnamed protein product [Orchesella dallaii]|uniref:Gustatory receptor n=1 Tax=Orchesella dallaii TaxID=48710 RepID=A0ABP1RS48_9HEXA